MKAKHVSYLSRMPTEKDLHHEIFACKWYWRKNNFRMSWKPHRIVAIKSYTHSLFHVVCEDDV